MTYDSPLVVTHEGRKLRGTAHTLGKWLPAGDYNAVALLDDGTTKDVILAVSPMGWARAIDPTERYDAATIVAQWTEDGEDPAWPSVPDLDAIDDTNTGHHCSPVLMAPVANLLLDEDIHWDLSSESPSGEYAITYDVNENTRITFGPFDTYEGKPVQWYFEASDEMGHPIEGSDLTLPLSTPPAEVAAAARRLLDRARTAA